VSPAKRGNIPREKTIDANGRVPNLQGWRRPMPEAPRAFSRYDMTPFDPKPVLLVVEEGRLRRHMIVLKGRVRDSLQFSIVDSEWLVVKARLMEALSPLDGERRKSV
jgi:hypothetical protein